jgi:hypothetical protein
VNPPEFPAESEIAVHATGGESTDAGPADTNERTQARRATKIQRPWSLSGIRRRHSHIRPSRRLFSSSGTGGVWSWIRDRGSGFLRALRRRRPRTGGASLCSLEVTPGQFQVGHHSSEASTNLWKLAGNCTPCADHELRSHHVNEGLRSVFGNPTVSSTCRRPSSRRRIESVVSSRSRSFHGE